AFLIDAAIWRRFLTAVHNVWSIAGDLTQPIFDAGTLKHRQVGAVAAYDEAEA
ncbi:MAG: hypothetical protein CBCREVIR_3145, partial [Candidatus Burkholderia crenata]